MSKDQRLIVRLYLDFIISFRTNIFPCLNKYYREEWGEAYKNSQKLEESLYILEARILKEERERKESLAKALARDKEGE